MIQPSSVSLSHPEPHDPATTHTRFPEDLHHFHPLTRLEVRRPLNLLADFRRLYAEALARWRRGLRDTVFPYGTYQMARLHNVTIAPAPT